MYLFRLCYNKKKNFLDLVLITITTLANRITLGLALGDLESLWDFGTAGGPLGKRVHLQGLTRSC